MTLGVSALMFVTLVGCGGDDTADDEAAPDDASADAADAIDQDPTGEADADVDSDDDGSSGSDGFDLTHSSGSATVMIDGTTYEFGAVDGSINVCTNVFGSFQVALPLLDDTGAAIDGSKITLELIEPGSEAAKYGENMTSAEVAVPEGVFIAGDGGFASVGGVEPPPIDVVPGESSASGTLTMIPLYGGDGPVEVEFTVQCD